MQHILHHKGRSIEVTEEEINCTAVPTDWREQLEIKGAIVFGGPENLAILQHHSASQQAKTFVEDVARLLLEV